MKRGLLFFLSLFLINFVSAQFFGGYGSFSITGFLDSPDIVLLALFLIIAAFVAFVLRRSNVFRSSNGENNRGIIAVISFSISLLSVYGIYNSGFNLQGIFSGLGISSGIMPLLIWAVIFAAAIFIIWQLSFGVFLLISGLIMIIISIFTNLIYEKTAAFFIGLVLLIAGIFFWKKSRKWWGRNVRSI